MLFSKDTKIAVELVLHLCEKSVGNTCVGLFPYGHSPLIDESISLPIYIECFKDLGNNLFYQLVYFILHLLMIRVTDHMKYMNYQSV